MKSYPIQIHCPAGIVLSSTSSFFITSNTCSAFSLIVKLIDLRRVPVQGRIREIFSPVLSDSKTLSYLPPREERDWIPLHPEPHLLVYMQEHPSIISLGDSLSKIIMEVYLQPVY
jgi:hypothetical protein